MQTEWSEQRTLDERLLGMYFNDFTIELPNTEAKDRNRKIQVVRSKTSEAGRIIDLLRSLYVNPAAIGVQSIGGRPPAETLRENIERAIAEAIDQLNGGAGDTPRKADVFNLLTLGRAARLGPVFGKDYYWDFPERGDKNEDEWRKVLDDWKHNGPVPFVWLDLPPENTFPSSWGNLEDEVLSWREMSWWDILEVLSPEEIGEGLPEASKRYDKVTLGIYSNRQYLAYAVMSDSKGVQLGPFSVGGSKSQKIAKIARQVQHGLGRSAIRIIGGPTTGRRQPGRYWMSALFHVAPLIEEADRLLSLSTMAMQARLFPPMFRTQFMPQDGTLDRPKNEKWEYGEIITGWVDQEKGRTEDLRAIFEPQTSQEPLAIWQATLERTMRISGAVEVLEAALGDSDETAWARRAKLDTATHRMKPFTDAVVAGDIDAAEMMLRSIAEGNEPAVMFRKGDKVIELTPDDVRGVAPILQGTYKLSLAQSKIANTQIMIQLIQAAANPQAPVPIDLFRAMEEFGDIEQPAEEYKNWVVHRAWTHPQTLDMLMQLELKRVGADLAGEAGMSAEELMGIPDDQLPPAAKLAALQAAGIAVPGANGAQANGAARAQSPFVTGIPERRDLQP